MMVLILLQQRAIILLGPGKIIVQSAGNDGSNPIHHQVDADSDGDDMKFNLTSTASKLEFELWYDGGEDVTIQVLGPGNVPNLTVQSGQKGTQTTNQGDVTVDNAFSGPENYNGDKRIAVILENSVAPGDWNFRLSSVKKTTVHAWMWNGDTESGFAFSTTDNHYTLINGACGKNVIAVDAMVTRNKVRVRDFPGVPDGTEVFVNENMDEMASFSSGGPTRDGRQKPEVVAPGVMIVSAMSGDIPLNSTNLVIDYRSIGDRLPKFETYNQQAMNGTSMSAPLIAAGLTSLLEEKADLDDDGIRAFIRNNTKSIGTSPMKTNRLISEAFSWHYREGYGLFDLTNFLNRQSPLVSSAQINSNHIEIEFSVMPNGADNKDNYKIIGPSSGSVTIETAMANNNVVTLALSGELLEGFQDSLKISGVAGLADPTFIEIDKIGTIIMFKSLLTNEIWRLEDSPYYIHHTLQIPNYTKLTIEPGTVVKFMPNAEEPSKLEIFGELYAQGTAQNPIIFTSLNESERRGWGGLYFDDEIPPTTLKHCTINYAENGVVCFSSNLRLEDCMISHSYDTGFFAQNCSPEIKRSIIWDSKGGQFGDGIYLFNASSSTIIENVTVVGNGRAGIACFSSNPQIVNSIVTNNSQIGLHSQGGTPPSVTYCDVWNNGINYNGVSPGLGSLSADPLFVNASEGDFNLLSYSPCLNAGDPNTQFNDPDGTRNDVGAWWRLSELSMFSAIEVEGINVELNWETIATDQADGIFILRSINVPVEGAPVNGVAYEQNDLVGNAVVIVNSQKIGTILDNNIVVNSKYYYSAWGIYKGAYYSNDPAMTDVLVTSVKPEDNLIIPLTFELHQNYPNPFNPKTTIQFSLPESQKVIIKVFNAFGQEINTLVNKKYTAGIHSIDWDARNKEGNEVASGIYFYQINTQKIRKTKKMLLLR